ncbi:uncharacterized protein LOC128872554 [Hylaeus volcanicus]|uniref:uncharacterized protein LOC128872554 n=1 Tax=Hylaeus volcanicus TaxID=313075 RepID=UPI0023B7A08D|nr:uncharacterized protein LOC128872554 [Hylaeus volcanicus]XP_053971351.1 uncharacterized protein LOC128872554 [Hylaeus volcanicus]
MEQTTSLLHDRTEITESNINRSEDITMEVDKRCRKVCAILGCRSNKKRMFQFPCPVKDNDRYMQWITACRREDFLRLSPKKVRTKVVCDLHFEDRYRFPTKLTRDAIPTCNLPEPAALVEPQEETVIEITEEEERKILISIRMIKQYISIMVIQYIQMIRLQTVARATITNKDEITEKIHLNRQ